MTTALSVIMPAYNEEAVIEAAVAEVRECILDRISGSELVVVNDGSRDATGARLDQLAVADPRVRVIHRANGGHGPALRTGMEAATGEILFLIDSDRQIPLADFEALWSTLSNGSAGAFGVRLERHDPTIRLWLTRALRGTIPVLFGVRLTDANVPFKLFRRHLWQAARDLIPPDTLTPSLFFAIFVAKRRIPISHIPINHRERRTGVVSIRRWRLLKFCATAFRQLIVFRWRLARAG
jgi:glycosyltransferase involved in cell wall biosynthesis